jgi:predicted nucleotidyltransferase
LVPTGPAKPAPLSGPLGRRVHRHRHEIKSIAAAYGAGNVRVFGSVARGVEQADSDIDLLLDLPADTGLFALGRLRRDLEELLHARVDVIPDDGLKLGARANVESDLVAL